MVSIPTENSIKCNLNILYHLSELNGCIFLMLSFISIFSFCMLMFAMSALNHSFWGDIVSVLGIYIKKRNKERKH